MEWSHLEDRQLSSNIAQTLSEDLVVVVVVLEVVKDRQRVVVRVEFQRSNARRWLAWHRFNEPIQEDPALDHASHKRPPHLIFRALR
jgi:hypothetical protein